MKKIIISGLLFFTFIASQGQTSSYQKSIYGGFLGNAPHGSVNFDMRLNPDKIGGLGFSAGLSGSYSYYGYKDATLGVPVTINYLLGKKNSYLELGVNGTPEFRIKKSEFMYTGTPIGVKEKDPFFHGHFNIGYRFQPLKDKGIMFNALWTPAISFKDKGYYSYDKKRSLLNFSIGLGYTFK